MMPTKLYNSLRAYMFDFHESAELAEEETNEYAEKFKGLDKYDQMEVDQTVGLDGWEYGLKLIDKLL